ncbi:MAG: hypothetical protein IJ727_12065, partial [Treponema sp.]|nr:hypothetical protein [Treponema sp.]
MSKFYKKFTGEKEEKERDMKSKNESGKKNGQISKGNISENKKKTEKPFRQNKEKRESAHKNTVSIRREMFDQSAIPAESKKIIEDFDSIVETVRNLSGKQKLSLYGLIKNLSHQLTDDRSSRRLGYMNEAGYISAYISYFMWWNLVRQASLFANMPKTAFDSLKIPENPVAIDIGSGTLTIVIALWLARPELRTKKITWYCMDLSQTALAAGEDLYYVIAARTIKASEGQDSDQSQITPWNIIRVKGAFGTSIKEKADFITCGNVFNEIIQHSEMPTDFLAKKYTGELLSYIKKDDATVLLVEPGDPHSARFISLMRNALIRQDYLPLSPCPHFGECPMSGRTHGRTTNSSGKNAKWCNFAFDTEDAPKNLLKLSEKAGLAKERASLSFVISKKSALPRQSGGLRQPDRFRQSELDSDSTTQKTF